MTDVPDGSGPIQRRPRMNDGGSPAGGALAIVLAVLAVVAGFFILRSISNGGEDALDFPGTGAAAGDDGSQTGSAGEATTTTLGTATTTTTEPPLVVTGASVLVANANGVSGSAGSMKRLLETGFGFQMVEPTNASTAVGDRDVSVIYYTPEIAGAEAVANSVNRVLGGELEVTALTGTPPTRDGTMSGAGVLLLLGNDKASVTLDDLQAATAAPANTNPPVAGGSTTTSSTVAG